MDLLTRLSFITQKVPCSISSQKMKKSKSSTGIKTAFFSGLSLQRRLPLLISLLLLLIIAAFTIISYFSARSAALRSGKERLNSLSGQLSTIFGQSAIALVNASGNAAADEVLKNQLRSGRNMNDTTALPYLDKLRSDSSWLLVELLDTSGQTVLRSANPGINIIVNRDSILASMNESAAQVGSLYNHNDSVIYPVIAPVSDKKIVTGYLLRWRLQSASERAVAQFSQLLGTDAKLYIGNTDETLWTDLREQVSLPPVSAANDLVTTRSILQTQWLLRVEFSRSAVLQPATRSLPWLLFIGLLLFFVGFIITRVISRSITRPIQKMTAVASEIAGGHYSLKVNVEQTDELGQLAGAFNSMMEKIRNASELQEVKVKERTIELEKNIAQLKESEDRFRGLLESAPDAMIIAGQNGNIVLVNSQTEKLFGYNKQELTGQPVELLIPGDLRQKHKQHRQNYYDQPKVRSMGAGLELFAVRKDGTTFPVEISLSPLETSEGLLVSAAIRDITERKQADEAILHLNKELESFTYSVSHDLRAPLRIIDGYADMLIEDYSGNLDENGNRTLAVIKTNARRMGQLIDDLLNLSHIGRKEPEKQLTDMNKLVKTVVDEQLAYSGTKAIVKLEKLEPAECDSNLIRQVWINLIANAIKYAGKQEQPVIEIFSSRNGNENLYTVKDNGVGFDMKYAGKLFGVFQRLHKLTEFEGTGIGLALVNRIIMKHNGKIRAEAEPGKGASFTFSLPV